MTRGGGGVANGKVREMTRVRNHSGRKGKWAKRLGGERKSGRNDPDSRGSYNKDIYLNKPEMRSW